jgi:hypothetical protein
MSKREARRSFFEKKEPKKLLSIGSCLSGEVRIQANESLFASFSSEKEDLP